MSQFSRTASQVDTLEQQLKQYDDMCEAALPERKQSADKVNVSMTEIQPSVEKFVSKAEAGENDANKRIYGAGMVSKIKTLRDRFSKLCEDFQPRYELLNEEWQKFEEQQKKEAEEAAQLELIERKNELEEQKKAEELKRIEVEEGLKKEEEEKRKIEEERLAKENIKQVELAAEKKKKEVEKEEEEQKKIKMEVEAKLQSEKKQKEEEELKKNSMENGKSIDAMDTEEGMTISIKTTQGITHSLSGIKSTQTIAELKESIEYKFKVKKAAQRLIFQGRLLSDTNQICTYKICDGSAIHMAENTRAAAASSSASSASATPSRPAKLLVPAGTICHLEGGKEQYDEILKECGNSRLVVTDWFAPWCGPCRMISPVFERLASRFSDVTFIKIDTELKPANSQLAQEHEIQGYPTFHFIINEQVKHSFSGANASNIEKCIKKYRAMVIPKDLNQSSSSSMQSRELGPVGNRVMSSLTTLHRNLSMDDFIIAVRTLLKFVKNIVENPGIEKFRKVRTANSTFQSRLGCRQGGVECMRAFGFRDVNENSENFLVISARDAEDPELRTVMSQLESAVESASASVARSSTIPTPSPSATPSPTPGGGGMGGGGMGDMGGPDAAALAGMFGGAGADVMAELMQDASFQQITRDMMSDPDAMTVIMQAQQALSSGDMATVQRLQGHPAMQRMHQAMTSNPAFLGMMMRQAAERGFPGMPGAAPAPTNGTATMPTAAPGAMNPTQTTPAPPAYPGAPSSAEEEERLLQEAIRLSMQDQQSPKSEDAGNKDEAGK